jgi:hypothetical protein
MIRCLHNGTIGAVVQLAVLPVFAYKSKGSVRVLNYNMEVLRKFVFNVRVARAFVCVCVCVCVCSAAYP